MAVSFSAKYAEGFIQPADWQAMQPAVSQAHGLLHGGSGVPDGQIQAAIQAGIRKMNFSTDLCYSFLDACRERDKSIVGIDLFMTEPIQRVQDFAEMKIKVLGANGRV